MTRATSNSWASLNATPDDEDREPNRQDPPPPTVEATDSPPCVLNVIPGFGPTAGAALVAHPGVAGIASDAFYLTMNKGAQAEAKKLGIPVVHVTVPGLEGLFGKPGYTPGPRMQSLLRHHFDS